MLNMALVAVRVAARCVSQIRGGPLFCDGGRVWRGVSLRYGRHEACIPVAVMVLMAKDQRSREWRCNGGFDNMLNEDNGGAKATQQSFELVTADLVSRHGATVVGLDVCENGQSRRGGGYGMLGEDDANSRTPTVQQRWLQFLTRARRAAAFRRVQRWPNEVVAAMEVAAAKWVGAEEREKETRVRALVAVRVAARCVSQIRGGPLFCDGGRVWRGVSLRYGRHEACIPVAVMVLMAKDQRSREWRCNGGFDNMLNEDNGGAKATQQSFELVTADLVSRHGATVVGLDVCENGQSRRGGGYGMLGEDDANSRTPTVQQRWLQFLTRARRAAAFRRVQRWPNEVVAAMEVAAAKWVGAEEREKETRVRVCVGKETMTWQTLIGDLS
ncbi:hypothetical protein DEO72_LG2g3667 [Vigna unguiculata]|uniref:Uncharacterized protein n=1 Tax=Vigna unguiculata TaxID=3917 RepID=A0A4D6L482_VIGUN|nr:hypothetical protein DEO72_LG2g3667 [Vigna unguiculata]